MVFSAKGLFSFHQAYAKYVPVYPFPFSEWRCFTKLPRMEASFSQERLRPFLIRVIAASLVFLGLFFLSRMHRDGAAQVIDRIAEMFTADAPAAAAIETFVTGAAGRFR